VLITISGVPGSGKTTVAKLVASELGLEHVYAGNMFREQASQAGLSLAEYLARAETDPSIDREIDRRMQERAARGEAVLEGRLAAFMAEKAGMPALTVFLGASESVRASRITGREGGATDERLREIQARESSDRQRYRTIYGVDYHDDARYDLFMETDGRTPEEVARAIVAKARERFPTGSPA
jgi:predicted cytidylate kinase